MIIKLNSISVTSHRLAATAEANLSTTRGVRRRFEGPFKRLSAYYTQNASTKNKFLIVIAEVVSYCTVLHTTGEIMMIFYITVNMFN